MRFKYRSLTFEDEDAPVHDGLVSQNTGIVEKIASGEVIAAINYQIVVFDNLHYVV
ncbi:MAG: hypothetical protein DDT18_01611 [Actinobacteria bacterium]|nr:hypothetical protein [Actinomycetota bacterium]